jgi:hypothetical protein
MAVSVDTEGTSPNEEYSISIDQDWRGTSGPKKAYCVAGHERTVTSRFTYVYQPFAASNYEESLHAGSSIRHLVCLHWLLAPMPVTVHGRVQARTARLEICRRCHQRTIFRPPRHRILVLQQNVHSLMLVSEYYDARTRNTDYEPSILADVHHRRAEN